MMALPTAAIAAASITAATAAGTTGTSAVTTAAAAAAAVAAMAGQHLAIAPHESDADHREENRDAKQQCTIHPKILQLKLKQVPYLRDSRADGRPID
jgi:hypothetical protein